MFKVQHRTNNGWEDLAPAKSMTCEHARFLDAAAWLADFIFAATEQIMTGERRPEDAYDPTGFRIVDTVRNEIYRMTADHNYRRESDDGLFDFVGDPVEDDALVSPDAMQPPSGTTSGH